MLYGEKVNLIKITKEYTDLIVKWRNSESVRNNFIFQGELTSEMHNDWLDNKVAKGEVDQFIIIDKSTGEPIGSTFLKDIDRINDKAEFGIFIGEENFRSKGYGTEATKIICEYGFKTLDLNKIMLRVVSTNEAAIKSYLKTGFKEEAYLIDEIKINNKYIDIIYMSMIKRTRI